MTCFTPTRSASNVLEEFLRQLAHTGQIGVGGIRLHRSKLRVVRKIGTLVSKLATNLKDTLKTAHNQTLEG